MQNYVVSAESWFHLFDIQAQTHEYFNFHSIRKTYFTSIDNGQYTLLGNFIFTIHEEMETHSRQVYGVLDVLGDFGGVQYVLFIVGSWVMGSYTEFKFNLKAMKKLYLARTKETKLFKSNVKHFTDVNQI